MAYRVTPSASAPSATDSPSGSRQSYRTDNPGWGGVFIRIAFLLLMVTDCLPMLPPSLLVLPYNRWADWSPTARNIPPTQPALSGLLTHPTPGCLAAVHPRRAFSRARIFQFSSPLFRGAAKAALNCAHRTTHRSSNFSFEGGLDGLPLRVSNEGLRRPRVARAQEII